MSREDMLEAARTVEAMPGMDGVLILPCSLRNHVTLQVTMRRLHKEVEEAGCELQTQIVTNPQAQPLLYLIDTRQWPEALERKFMTSLGAVKAGATPTDLEHLRPVEEKK